MRKMFVISGIIFAHSFAESLLSETFKKLVQEAVEKGLPPPIFTSVPLDKSREEKIFSATSKELEEELQRRREATCPSDGISRG